MTMMMASWEHSLGAWLVIGLLAVCCEASQHVEHLGVAIAMRDGKRLTGDVFLPAAEGRFPTIYIHTPYNRQFGGAPLPDELLSTELRDRDHYAYVIVDWRGFFGSEEAAVPGQKPNHGHDTYDVIEWIGQQSWSNGKVGMWGISAVGAVQYQAAIQKPPHLVCIVPSSAHPGFPYQQFYYGGVLELYHLGVFNVAGHGRGQLIKSHPTYDRFWKAAERRDDLSRIDLPTLFITGWYDTHPGLKIHSLRALATPDKQHCNDMKLIVGPWLHTKIGQRRQGALEYPAAESFADRQTMRFFDYWLRGRTDNGWDREPTIRYFQMGTNRWKGAPAWPPKTTTVKYYPGTGGRLTKDLPGAEKPDAYRYDPKNPTPTLGGCLIELRKAKLQIPNGPRDLRQKVEGRQDVITYTTDVLEENLEVVGAVRVKLYVSSDRRDTDFAVRLTDVYPDGRSMLVTDGIQGMKFRKSLERPELIEPGKVYAVTVKLPPTAQTFVKGHRIRIVVSSANYPRFAANRNLDRQRLLGPRALVATNRVYHDQEHPSAVLFPAGGQSEEPQP